MKLLSAFFRTVFGILSRLFGTISWSPPSWLTSLKEFLNRMLVRSRVITGGSFKSLAKRSAAALAVVAAVAALLVWNASRQKGLLDVTGTRPGLTKLEDVLKPDPIHIRFSGSAARLDQIGKVVAAGITISPPIDGEWKWLQDSDLIFVPKEDWAVGREYTVRMERSLFPDHVRLATYSYSFKTPAFRAELGSTEFYQDPEDPKVRKVLATVTFTHPVDTADFEKRVHLRRADQSKGFLGIGAESYPFTVSYDKYKGEAYIHSKPMDIPDKDTSMVLTVDAGVRAERGGPPTDKGLEARVTIPGKFNYLRIASAGLSLVRNERYEPEQVLIVQTTTGVQEDEITKNLSVVVLPKDLPPIQGQEGRKDYRWAEWSDPSRIGPEVLNLSTPLPLESLPRDREFAVLHSFKYTATPGRYLYIKLAKGIKAFGGYLLAGDYEAIVRVPDFPQELGIMAKGSVLSLHGEKKVSVYGRDLEAVRFQIGRVLTEDINHLVSQTHGDITNPYFTNYNFSDENITERFTEVRDLSGIERGKTQYASVDLSGYLKTGAASNRGLFFLRVDSWDPVHKRPTGKSDKRLILVTDLGVLAKDNADGTRDVFVQSIRSGLPVLGARVDILGKNGVSVFGTTTDGDGRARFPKLTDFEHEKTPTVYIVRQGSDLSFLPYDRSERRLNLSRFDVGGDTTSGTPDRLNAYLFSDRGIYRPGDEFHVGIIVKSADWKRNLSGIPLEAAVTDARGLEVRKWKISLPLTGFTEIAYRPEETAPTGNYTTSLYIIKDGRRAALLGSTPVRVEEFLPDRLKISSRLSQERQEGWVAPEGLKGMVTLMNLYGTAAVDHRVAADITLSPAFPAFKRYRDYTFYDPARTDKSFNEQLQDTTTNDKGEAEFELGLERFAKATYRLTFLAEGYEAEGGRGVSSASSVLVSPLAYLVGYKADGNLRYISKGSSRTVELIAVDPSLKKTAVPGLRAQIIEVRYVSALTKQRNGVYKYQSVKREIPVSTKDLSIPAQGVKFALPTGAPGDFVLVLKDGGNTELNRVGFTVAGKGNLTRSLEKNAELLIKLNKSDFSPGEEIELSIRAPYTGAGLITIERDRVYAYRWFRTKTTSAVEHIRIPANFEGNGYVNVSFVRAMDSREIFMSPLSYGVMPFSVSRDRRTVAVDLDTPDLARPGEPFRIRYRANRRGRAVIYAVDEGILQVARYKTPDPLAYFFRKRALEVRTSQILDLIMPEMSLLRALSAPGGDEAGREALGKNLNPFKRKRDKPVVYWSGIVDAGPESRELSFRVPDYFNGTLRVMAVAVSTDAVGATEKKAFVRGHFVLSPNVPTFVAPGDEFTVSVSVANNVEGSGKDAPVRLDLAASEHVEILDKSLRSLKVSEGREGSASFRLRAKHLLGAARLVFTASLGDKKTSYAVEASVRPAIPYMTDVRSGFFKNGKADIEVTRSMYPDYRVLDASASPLPLGLAHGLTAYLERFPYLCTEQLVSRTLPAVVLKTRPEFGYLHKNAAANIDKTVDVLRARQNAEGAFGFWAANSHTSDFASVYALHFLTEARERGFTVPQEPIERGKGYLRRLAQSGSDTLAKARTRAYAIYVLTRNGVVTTSFVDALREQLDKTKETKKWKKDITGAYLAATYKMLRLDAKADGLIAKSKMGEEVEPDYDHFYDGLAHDAQYLYLLAKHFPERFRKLSKDDMLCIDCMVNWITRGGFNTISSAYTILAMDAYASAVGEQAVADIRIREILEKGMKDLALPKGLFPKVAFSDKAKKVRIESASDYPTFWQVTMGGFDRELPKSEIKEQLEVQREYRDSNGRVVSKAQLGSELEVHLKMRSVRSGRHGNVAIVDLLPGGFEVVLDKSRNGRTPGAGRSWDSPIGTRASTWYPDFVDLREDRVVLFGSVGDSAQEFVYRIKATNKGTYTIPPAFAESMYNRAVRARTLPGVMTVEGKGKEKSLRGED